MPIYEGKARPMEALEKLQDRNVCKECGASLGLFWDAEKCKVFLACNEWRRTHHEGIERPASRYELEGLGALTIKARREIMESQIGVAKARQLAKYEGVAALTKRQVMEIIDILWPGAPPPEKAKAAALCISYRLNPLAKHVYLIPFNTWADKEHTKKKTVWATVLGIGATRLMAARKGTFSYVDDTPRIMTTEEQEKRFGQSYPDRIYAIVKVKDPATGAEVPGYGWWPRGTKAYGEDKGNTPFNMASNRAERQGLDRLRPGEMPSNVEVMDESIADSAGERGFDIEAEATEVAEDRGDSGGGFSDADKERIRTEADAVFATGAELFAWGSKRGLALEEMQDAVCCTNPADIKDVPAATKAVKALIPKV